MKSLSVNFQVLFIYFLSLFTLFSFDSYSQDKTMSPYFMVMSAGEEEPILLLKNTTVDVNISGVIADVSVRQVYSNTGKDTLDAVYVFPASTRAAVYDMTMLLNGRTIKAVVEEKLKARNMYRKAKKKGRTASLLEQERPNVFNMRLSNIAPGSTVEVNLRYTEMLIPENNIYEFIYPTVVGPRYVSQAELETGIEDWVVNPYLDEKHEFNNSLKLNLHLYSAIPIKSMLCDTHQTQINYKNKTEANLTLNNTQSSGDFVMQYALAGDVIESGVLVYEDPKGEKYFLAMMQPPKRVKPKSIPKREYVFIVDVSGSMSGFPLQLSKQVIKKTLSQLNENDKFNIVYFAGGSAVYANESLSASTENINKALKYLDKQNAQGGTELLNALKRAMSLNNLEDYSKSFIILTDGYVTVEKATFDYIKQSLGKANFFAFGIGSSVNRYIIEGIANVGRAESLIVMNEGDAIEQSQKFIDYVTQPILTNIKYQFNGVEAYDVLPEKVPDLFAQKPLIISGKYKGDINGQLAIKGISGDKKINETITIKKKVSSSGVALKYLWAREKVRLLADYSKVVHDNSLKEDIVELGKKYNLLTEFTSFIAIDPDVDIPVQKESTVEYDKSAFPPITSMCIVDDSSVLDDDVAITFYEQEEEAEAEVTVFTLVESMPEYPGGDDALKAFISSSIVYPAKAAENGISGTVYIKFTIDIDGSIIDVKVVRGISQELDNEAIRVVKAMPKWIPGKQRGRPVKTSYTIPVRFRLS